MKQNSSKFKLIDFTDGVTHPFGNEQGKKTFRLLADFVESQPSIRVFGISFEGIVATDASFPRESVISVAKHFRESRGIYLENISNPDILDNWDYAARAKDQPIVYWEKDSYRILGPVLTSASKELLDYVLTKDFVLASQVASDLDLSVQNASTRLKKLVSGGYILRSDAVAESGGIEYIYSAIK